MSEETTTIVLSKEEKAVIDALEKLNIIQINNVVKYMEEAYGISAAAPVAVAAAPAAAVEEGPKTRTVVLKSAGGNKIAVIKIIKEITGLGLVEAKAVADNGGNIKENIPAEEAEAIKTQLTEAGAEVELV